MATARISIAALAALILLTPAGAWAGDRYGVDGGREATEVSDAYAYRRVEGSRGGECRAYCLPPGYRLEPSREGPPPPGYDGRPVADPGVDYRYTDGTWARDDRYGERRVWGEARTESRYRREESGWREASGDRYDDRYEGRYDDGDWDDGDWTYDDRGGLACERPARGRDRGGDYDDHAGCGELRLPGSFFYGATGGVGPDYIDAGGGASAYASARASVGVSIRIGGGRGRPGRPGGGHPPRGGGGCGCGH
ncbi:MAG: hypothetical protein GC145_16790 [Caulobacter sp.]|nr:hypothetical protein [Caulobacter sp.]